MSGRGGRSRSTHQCSECGWETAKWVGRCGECQAWGSMAEVATGASATARVSAAPVSQPAVPIGEVDPAESGFRSSGVPELDRVLGGGLVPGAAILLAGEPGVGKSTLLLEVAAQTARYGRTVLYVTGEESAAQVRMRADRTGAIQERLFLAAETDLGAVLTHIETVRPEVVIVDSVQTVGARDVEGIPGGVTQVKEVSAALVRTAKTHAITTVMVGHVTKDGSIAGPRVLEHLVDVVVNFEGERSSRLRLLRAVKNRFGPVDEVGCFDLTATGIEAVADPTGLFMERHPSPVPGSCLGVTLEGRRPLLTEVQTLVTGSAGERVRRTTSGVDSSRLAMVLAVLEARCGMRLSTLDVFASTVGGARLHDSATDLALALSLVSALFDRPVPGAVVAIGEIGLSGEIRRVRDLPERINEAHRLGFERVVVPVGSIEPDPTRAETSGERSGAWAPAPREGAPRVLEVRSLGDALSHLGLADPTRAR